MLRAAVIGVGRLGSTHAGCYAKIPEVELIGVFDSDEGLRERVAKLYGCTAFAALDSLLGEIDIATVAVPTLSHFEVAERCLKKGVHLLVEKPLTKSLSEAERLVKLARDKHLKLQVGHIERFNPALLAAREHIDRPMFIESHRLAQFNPRGTDVDVVLDLMIHDLDLISHLVGEPPTNLQASGVEVITESDDIANARLNFRGGCVANLTASRISARNMRKMRLFQKDAYISIDFLNRTSELYKLVPVGEDDSEVTEDTIVGKIPVADSRKTILYSQLRIEDKDMLLSEVSSFIQAVKGNTAPEVSGEEGLNALRLALNTIEAIESHKKKVAT